MTSKSLTAFLAIAFIALSSVATNVFGQSSQANLLGALPPSDAVVLIDVKRVVNEAMPKLMAGNPAKLGEINAEIEKLKSRTGIDARTFNTLAVGMRYSYPTPGITRVRSVGLAEGTFSPSTMASAGAALSAGQYREEKYKDKTIYIFRVEQQIGLFGITSFRLTELAVWPLNDNTLALGDLESVKSAIDLGNNRTTANAELISLALRQANSIASFSGNISPEVIDNLKVGNDAIARDLATVRQVYGSLGMTERDLEVFAAARTTNAESARNLSDTVEGLKQLGALFIHRLPVAKGTLARSALTNLKISTSGNEIQIRTGVAQAEVAPLVSGR